VSGNSSLITTQGVNNKFPGIDKYGWYDVNAYVNPGGYYFIGNNYQTKKFPTTYNA